MMDAQIERGYDGLEREALISMMSERASRMKQPKASDLYTRPFGAKKAKEVEAQVEQAEHANEWLAQYEFSEKEDDIN